MPEEALPSGRARQSVSPHGQAHPADQDGPTLAVASPTTDPSELVPYTQPPHTPQMAPYPSPPAGMAHHGLVDPAMDGGTLIMESPVRDEAGGSGPHAVVDTGPRAATTPFGQGRAPAFAQQPPQQFPPSDPRVMAQDASRPDEMNYGAPLQRRAPNAPAGGSSRALVFVGVAVVTMVIVVVAGLLILAFSD